MGQVIEFLLLTWQVWIEFPAPGFALVQPLLLLCECCV